MTIEVVFDGKVFVPTGPVDLPAGTRCVAQAAELTPPPRMTAEEEAETDRILRGDGSPPPFQTVEETMAYTRGRPWPYLLEPFTPPPPKGQWAPPEDGET